VNNKPGQRRANGGQHSAYGQKQACGLCIHDGDGTCYFAGLTVEILHLDGLTSVYCGLAEGLDVTIGDSVTAGTVIGCVGETAIFESLDGPHLHFEMRKSGSAVDPSYYLPGE